MSRPQLHALQGFVAAARSGNLSRAADALHLTVSALSHQIRGLEERVGQRLFVRGARGVQLTEDGRALFERIAPHLDAIEHGAASRPRASRRRADADADAVVRRRAGWCRACRASSPRIRNCEISLQSNVRRWSISNATPALDAGLRFGPGQWPGLDAVHLFDDWVMPTASPALIERLGRPTLETLGDFPLLGDAARPLERLVRALRRHAADALRRRVRRFRERCTAPRPKAWASRWAATR